MANVLVTVDVRGLAELEAALLELGNALSGKILFKALMDAALPIQNEARARAPKSIADHYSYKKKGKKGQKTIERTLIQSGNLRKNITRKRLKSRNEQTGANVGISWRANAFYGRHIEFGTSKMAAKPFLRPAFDAKKEDALTIFKEKLATNIEKQRQIIAARTAGLA